MEEQTSFWKTQATTIKGLVIFILMLMLLIPALMVEGIINEREGRRNEAIFDISFAWNDEDSYRVDCSSARTRADPDSIQSANWQQDDHGYGVLADSVMHVPLSPLHADEWGLWRAARPGLVAPQFWDLE